MKSGLIVAIHLTLPASSATAQQYNHGAVGEMWTLFTEKCSLFIDDPNSFVQTPTSFTIRDWKWIMRAASSVGFIEYFSPSPDGNQQFTAIGNATTQGFSLECSLAGLISGTSTAGEAFNVINTHFQSQSNLTVSSEIIAFFGNPNDVAALKEYYSTSHIVRIEGGFPGTNLVSTIRTDDGGSVYFEVEAVK